MKNLLLSRKFRPSFAIALLCLGVLVTALMVGASGDDSQKASSTKQGFTETLPGSVKLEMVALPGGSFMMGSKSFLGDSEPIHSVTLKPFYMGKYEVTQAQWMAVMDNNPSSFKGDTLPVEKVSWNEVKEFCKKLSKLTGKEYRLPSEAEWEYAARAGSTGVYCFGDDESLLGEYAWYKENSGNKTHPVGQKKPNAWGLCDVHGNVLEWCEDISNLNYKGAPVDGSAWVTGSDVEIRVVRGGSWIYNQNYARVGERGSYLPGFYNYDLGFRVVSVVRPSS